MKIRKGDNVKVMTGKDRGKTGKVIQVFPDLNKIAVEGVNIAYKHAKTRRQGEKGQRIEFASPMSATNVQLVCPKCAKVTRLGLKQIADASGKNRKVRTCRKCGEAIE